MVKLKHITTGQIIEVEENTYFTNSASWIEVDKDGKEVKKKASKKEDKEE